MRVHCYVLPTSEAVHCLSALVLKALCKALYRACDVFDFECLCVTYLFFQVAASLWGGMVTGTIPVIISGPNDIQQMKVNPSHSVSVKRNTIGSHSNLIVQSQVLRPLSASPWRGEWDDHDQCRPITLHLRHMLYKVKTEICSKGFSARKDKMYMRM